MDSIAFASALYGEIAGHDRNICVAPASIRLALAMAYAGAQGETAAELARALGVSETGERHEAHRAWMATPLGELAVANAIFGQSSLRFRSEFVTALAENYGARLHEVDFVTRPEQARVAINDFVREHTRGVIDSIVPAGLLDPLTRLMLVNAIYFKGTWAVPFDKDCTSVRPFFLPGGRSMRALFMHEADSFKLLQVDEGQILELPYQQGACSMVVILPWTADDLWRVETGLPAKLGAWLTKLDRTRAGEVAVYLPRFRLDADLQINTALTGMGVVRAFDERAADFSKMADCHEGLALGAVLHRAVVEVNEAGTIAAAATATAGMLIGARPSSPRVFRASHPFVFLIRDHRTNLVLFLGRLMAADEAPADAREVVWELPEPESDEPGRLIWSVEGFREDSSAEEVRWTYQLILDNRADAAVTVTSVSLTRSIDAVYASPETVEGTRSLQPGEVWHLPHTAVFPLAEFRQGRSPAIAASLTEDSRRAVTWEVHGRYEGGSGLYLSAVVSGPKSAEKVVRRLLFHGARSRPSRDGRAF